LWFSQPKFKRKKQVLDGFSLAKFLQTRLQTVLPQAFYPPTLVTVLRLLLCYAYRAVRFLLVNAIIQKAIIQKSCDYSKKAVSKTLKISKTGCD